MKGVLIYIAGLLTAFLVMYVINQENQSSELTIFPEKGECISKNQFRVFQALGDNAALATEKSSNGNFFGITVLFMNDEGKYYYDDEIIKISKNQCARQIGIYEYKTQSNMYKTVPVVNIE